MTLIAFQLDGLDGAGDLELEGEPVAPCARERHVERELVLLRVRVDVREVALAQHDQVAARAQILQAPPRAAVPLKLPVEGSYRVFADFTTGGERRTLGIDLTATGGPLPYAWWDSIYAVELHQQGDRLVFDVRGDSGPVQTQPYLGAGGHLVVLREGDLAYIHAHAEQNELAFDVPFPGTGRYRLYLQFKVAGTVQTVRFEVTR